jgi:anti-sigma regulatory factor (Ser/Thr protein kinase)
MSQSAAPGQPPAGPWSLTFGFGDLPGLRRAVMAWSARAGLPAERAIDFVLAVHEIAANAVVHGSPAARLLLREQDGMAVAEITDGGRWQSPAAPAAPAHRDGGMGLSLARQVCDRVQVRACQDGTTVLLGMHLADPAPRPGQGNSGEGG